MDKKKLLESLSAQLEMDRNALLEATQATYEAATHEESKPENEYDTRGLEASYLAGAQSKRVSEIEEALSAFKHISLKNFSPEDPLASTAVAELESEGKKIYVFLMPKGGGIHVQHEDKTIQVVTGASPLGEALLGLKVGSVAVVDTGKKEREYEILHIW